MSVGLRLMLLTALLLSAVVAALVGAKLINRDGGGGSAQDRPRPVVTSTTHSTLRITTTTTSDDVAKRNGPGMQLYPQRAQAGAPLQLLVRGDGCAGGNGVVSIAQLGAARDTRDIDRLVVRRQIDVEPDGSWVTRPLLVGQPPGSYRVSASCQQRAAADNVTPVEDRRNLFTATEVLELTAPAVVDSFDVTPPFAPPNAPLTVLISGSGRCPASSAAGPGSVSGMVIPNAGATGGPRSYSAVVDAQGNWRAQVTFDASEAVGSYSVSATCSAGFAFGDQTIRFMDTSGIVVPPIFPWTATPPTGPGSPATPIPGWPTYTG